MKIVGSVEKCYDEQFKKSEILKKEVDQIFDTIRKDTKWHYESRIKKPEDYALKIETGRNIDPNSLEDFFACTLVVENYDKIKMAMPKINKHFKIKKQRPQSCTFTTKSPDSFPYDDLRLYVNMRPAKNLPDTYIVNRLSDVLFEIQIKTFLQHAWDIAAHDLVYKGDEISWPKGRVAYQIKAMLEHAEVSIHEIENIKQSSMLKKENGETRRLNKIKTFLIKNWDGDRLPGNLIRLSKNIDCLLCNLNTHIDHIQESLNTESTIGRGASTLNLSPYLTIVQTIINRDQDLMLTFLRSQNSHNYKIPIPVEIEQRDIFINRDRNIIRIGW